ncbi:MAG TPA: GtrA family protein [Candidatus Saccharimonadales bacterium]|nr:GtrA family protein [Candidatus Saccharimonadales bacterium]
MARAKTSTTTQAGKFGLVGILNTLIDYIIFQSLTKIFSIPLSYAFVAKLISGSVAMINSFYFNRTWVFKNNSRDSSGQALKFILSTLVGVLVIQTTLTQYFITGFPYFGNVAFQIADSIGLVKLLPDLLTHAFVLKTVAFGIATVGSLTWNFFMYRNVVFK